MPRKRTVSGYKKSDGTKVGSYKRTKTGKKRSVSGYTKSDGTKVSAYKRKKVK